MIDTLLTMVKENWIVFVIMGCFFVFLFVITEIARRKK